MNSKKKKPKTTTTTEQPVQQTKPLTQKQLADIYALQQMQEEGEAYQAAYEMAGMNSMPVPPLTPEQMAIRDKLNAYYDVKQKDPTLKPKFGWGGAIDGAMQYGSMGSSFGTIGTIVGAAAGLILGSDEEDKELEAKKNMDRQRLNATYYSSPAANNPLGLTAIYPMGGQIIEPNAELEKQEGFRIPNPTGQPVVGNVNGPSHDQGGVPVALPNGTQIYSDRLKHINESGKKETFADTEKRYQRQLSRYQKETSDPISKRTNQIMSERIQSKLQSLFEEQEAMKSAQGIKDQNPQYPNGGNVGNPPIGRYIYRQPEWESRLYNPTSVIPVVNPDGTTSTHKMMSYEADGKYKAAPTIINQNGRLVELSPRDAMRYAEENNTYKEFNTSQDAESYAANGYKKGTNLEEFKDGGIYIKPENRGKFNATKARTGKTTEELTHSSNPITRKRAIFAQNAAKWKHEDGGVIGQQYPNGGIYNNPVYFHNFFNKLSQYGPYGPNDEQLMWDDMAMIKKEYPGLTTQTSAQQTQNTGYTQPPVQPRDATPYPTMQNKTLGELELQTYNMAYHNDKQFDYIKPKGLEPKIPSVLPKGETTYTDYVKQSWEPKVNSKNTIGNVLGTAAELAPQIYNLFQKRPEEKNIDRFMNTDAIKAERMNVTQQVRDLERTYAAIINDQSLSPAERLMASRQLQSEKNKLYQGVDNQYITDINQAKQMNTAIKQQNIQTAMTLEDQYAADTAAYMNMKAQAAGDISQYAQKKRLEGNINTQNEQLQNALKSAFPTYSFNADGSITNKETGELLSAEEIKRVEDYFTGLTTLNRTTLKQDPYWSNTGYGNQSAYSYAYGQAIHPSN